MNSSDKFWLSTWGILGVTLILFTLATDGCRKREAEYQFKCVELLRDPQACGVHHK